jgi:hypothetical protein
MVPLLPLLMKSKDNILATMEARTMIEIETASLAAVRASEEEINGDRVWGERVTAIGENYVTLRNHTGEGRIWICGDGDMGRVREGVS